MEEEIWKDIGIIKGVDYTGMYQVSNYGEVKSLNYNHTGKEKILTPISNSRGYLSVGLSKNGKCTLERINRIVGLTFIPIPEQLKHLPLDKLEVDHIDGNRTNNRLDNLRWADRSGNERNPITIKRISQSLVNNPKLSQPVVQIDKNTNEVIKEWSSMAEAERQLGIRQANISDCCRGVNRHKSAGGYKWRYK